MEDLDRIDKMEKALKLYGIMPDDKVYRLCVSDVLCVLEGKGLLQKLTANQVNELTNHINRRLEIPFDEYIIACIETHEKFEEWTTKNNNV